MVRVTCPVDLEFLIERGGSVEFFAAMLKSVRSPSSLRPRASVQYMPYSISTSLSTYNIYIVLNIGPVHPPKQLNGHFSPSINAFKKMDVSQPDL